MHSPDPAALSALLADRLGPGGETPLLRLGVVGRGLAPGARLWGKAEFLNPTGSVKDRAARSIVAAALRAGEIGAGRTLLDASSGNTGIAYAMLGARLRFPVAICLPKNASPERVAALQLYGATVIYTDPVEGTDGAQREARRLATESPSRYYYPDQYNNPANPAAHFHGTGPELWRQTSGGITHLVVGVGTGGTLSGTARYLKQVAPAVRVVGVQPSGPMHGIEGLKHIPTALRPGTYDDSLVDDTVEVETEVAQQMARRLVREEGLWVGTSSGAAVAAAAQLSVPAGAGIVAVLPDGGERYLAEPSWGEGP